tara:strand:+ start:154 stop:264 length:111 start_codon:yes stop_codon:yes gene_type:complete
MHATGRNKAVVELVKIVPQKQAEKKNAEKEQKKRWY